MRNILSKLIRVGILSPRGLWHFLIALAQGGVNLMVLLDFAKRTRPQSPALVAEGVTYSYLQLYEATCQMIGALQQKGIQKKQKIGLICRNHSDLVKALFACSRLGADVYLLNVEMSQQQAQGLFDKQGFDALIYDNDLEGLVHNCHYNGNKIPIQNLPKNSPKPKKIPRANGSKVVVLTGGTSGSFKLAERKPSVFTFLNPFFALLTQLNLDRYKRLYIATPIYHGFGVAALLIAVVLRSQIIISRRFETEQAIRLIEEHQIEVITLVPLMLDRMLQGDSQRLASLQIILSGGAALAPSLARKCTQSLGPKLSNLYGSSEAGFCIMATPNILVKWPKSIGKAIQGVHPKILDKNGNELPSGRVGELGIQSAWTMSNKSNNCVLTGDLAYVDEAGLFFLCGRSDDMIVSGGENVYPIELEYVLAQHPAIKEAAAIGIPDAEFGQRLKAFVVLKDELTEAALKSWLKEHAARYHQPKEIVFLDALPYTAIGKLNKRKLS